MIYAHRLGADYGPECSRAALAESLNRRVEGLETDVVLTADDAVFALHDPILEVSTDASGWANDVSADVLRSARLRDAVGEPSDERPPFLEEVFEAIPEDMPIQLDVKAYADGALARRTAERASEVAIDHGTHARVEVISFFSEACLAAAELGLDARLVAWSDYDPSAMADWASGHGCVGVAMEGFILNRRIATAVSDAGLTLSVGAVNSRDQVERLLPFEPQILVSDRPAELRFELADLLLASPAGFSPAARGRR
jgi:glycerophosphoryl diester phosphodiesterase